MLSLEFVSETDRGETQSQEELIEPVMEKLIKRENKSKKK